MASKHKILYWSNSCGDFFRPDDREDDFSYETIDLDALPKPLQCVSRKFWTERLSVLVYLVQLDGAEGLLLVAEYGADDSPDWDEVMEKLKDKAEGIVETLRRALSEISPNVLVEFAPYCGFRECHELRVFIPASESDETFYRSMYLTDRLAFGGTESIPDVKHLESDPDYLKFRFQRQAEKNMLPDDAGEGPMDTPAADNGMDDDAMFTAKPVFSLPGHKVARLVDAYIDKCQSVPPADDSQIIDKLMEIFTREELEEMGFGGFIKAYCNDL